MTEQKIYKLKIIQEGKYKDSYLLKLPHSELIKLNFGITSFKEDSSSFTESECKYIEERVQCSIKKEEV